MERPTSIEGRERDSPKNLRMRFGILPRLRITGKRSPMHHPWTWTTAPFQTRILSPSRLPDFHRDIRSLHFGGLFFGRVEFKWWQDGPLQAWSMSGQCPGINQTYYTLSEGIFDEFPIEEIAVWYQVWWQWWGWSPPSCAFRHLFKCWVLVHRIAYEWLGS